MRDPKYRRSPIPKGGLEIPIYRKVFKGDTPDNVFKKMGEFLERFYVEPDKIPPTESLACDDEGEVCKMFLNSPLSKLMEYCI